MLRRLRQCASEYIPRATCTAIAIVTWDIVLRLMQRPVSQDIGFFCAQYGVLTAR